MRDISNIFIDLKEENPQTDKVGLWRDKKREKLRYDLNRGKMNIQHNRQHFRTSHKIWSGYNMLYPSFLPKCAEQKYSFLLLSQWLIQRHTLK